MNTARSTSSTAIGMMLWLIPALVACYFFVKGFNLYILSTESAAWPRTSAVINNVTVREENGRHSNWFDAWVDYQYEVGTETYVGLDGPYMLDERTGEPLEEKEAHQRAIKRFPQGRLIEVAYNPSHHEDSTLYAGQPQRAYQNFMIALSCLLLAAWMGFSDQRSRKNIQPAR